MVDEETGEVPTPEGTGDGDKSELAKQTETANAAAERMEKANEKAEKILLRNEELEATRTLGGGSEAGQPAEKAPEFTPDEKASRVRIKAVADSVGASWAKNYE